jgi:hypothetical protein
MAEERKQFALHDLKDVLRALEELGFPCTLIGGQAVYCWAGLFVACDPALQQFSKLTDFLSKDIDFQGSAQAAKAVARKLGCRAEVPDLHHAFGNLMAGKLRVVVAGAPLNIEILRKVPGFEVANLSRYAVREEVGDVTIQLLDPVGMLMAKSWNVVHIAKEGRRDTEQLLIMVACVRAYLRLVLAQACAHELPLRGFLSTMERVLVFSESPAGRKTAEKCSLDWRHILPGEIEEATELELVALREKRLPRWKLKIGRHQLGRSQNLLHRQMLAILAETAR